MLVEIKERSLFLMDKIDDIVWSISSKNDTVGDLLLRISQFAATVFEARDIEYEVNVPQPIKDLKLDMQRRQHIYLILKEAINNLIKYSACNSACISARYSGGKLTISITDNGKGFDIETVRSGNGLTNMKKRTDELFGTLLIDAQPGNGTRIVLSVEIE
jgi:signal transduction histidine kinase